MRGAVVTREVAVVCYRPLLIRIVSPLSSSSHSFARDNGLMVGWCATSIRRPSKAVKIIPWPLSSVRSGSLCLHGPCTLPETEYARVSVYTSSFQLDQIINNLPVLVL